jgi:hypothetical protein
MTNGPDDQPGQEPPPPPPPPPSGGRGLFSRPDTGLSGDLEPRTPPPPPPPRQDPRVRSPAPQQPPPQQGTDDNPFLLPNERGGPVYGAAPPLPLIPLALMVLAIVVGGVLFYMSQEDKKDSGGITPQQASSALILHLDGLDMTEDAFRREISKGIANGRIPCNVLAPQPADNIAAGLRLGALRMEVPNTSGVASKKDQKADDASLILAATIVKDTCPRADVPAPSQPAPGSQPGQPVPGAASPTAPGGQPGQPVPGAGSPTAPGGAPQPGGTPRPATPPAAPAPGGGAPPAATPRP